MAIKRSAATQEGSAYDLPEPSYDAELVQVGRRTPCGEMLMRYWHPIATAEEVKDLPLPVRVLGEDLILFQTLQGRYGLVYPRCAHRGSSLIYGKVEERGIRCCYHGWLFDTEGRCLEQPCEPGGGKVASYRQLVFAYLGPPERKPVLPRYDILEALAADEKLVANGSFIGTDPARYPCNWLQIHENAMDSWHVFILHSTFSNVQFHNLMTIRPEIKWESTDSGTIAVQIRTMPDGQTMRRIVEIRLPSVMSVPDPTFTMRNCWGKSTRMRWTLPVGDANSRTFNVGKFPKDTPPPPGPWSIYGGKLWTELTSEEHQRNPGDYEAQVSQGAITLHSEEHLVSSDRGVSMYRRRFREQIELARKGGDVVNVDLEGDGMVRIRAGNFLISEGAGDEQAETPVSKYPRVSS
jgi:nitrite reductase/ring-hydroxylating ferredoxin subunit